MMAILLGKNTRHRASDASAVATVLAGRREQEGLVKKQARSWVFGKCNGCRMSAEIGVNAKRVSCLHILGSLLVIDKPWVKGESQQISMGRATLVGGEWRADALQSVALLARRSRRRKCAVAAVADATTSDIRLVYRVPSRDIDRTKQTEIELVGNVCSTTWVDTHPPPCYTTCVS